MRKGWVLAAGLLAAPVARGATLLEPSLRLTAEERFDGDVGGPRSSGLSGQLMTKLTPRLGLEAKGPTLTADSFYALDFIARHGSGSTHFDHRAGLEGRASLSRRLRVDGTLRLFRVSDPLSLPRQGLAAPNRPVAYGRAGAGLTARLAQRWDTRVGYTFEGAKLLDGSGREAGLLHVPQAELLYRWSRRLTLGVDYRYQGFVFGQESSQSHAPGVLGRYRLTRLTTLSARGGPVRFSGAGGAGGTLPRYLLELARDGELYDVGVVLGHDLVGASGLDSAQWADFASTVVARRLNDRVSFYGAGSVFRNGRAPGQGAFRLRAGPEVSQGYALSAGVEWRLNRYTTLQGNVDRIAQLGTAETADDVDLTRNVLAVRAVVTAW